MKVTISYKKSYSVMMSF